MKGGSSLSFYRLQRGLNEQRAKHNGAQRTGEIRMPLKGAGFDGPQAYAGRSSLFSMLHRFAAGLKTCSVKK